MWAYGNTQFLCNSRAAELTCSNSRSRNHDPRASCLQSIPLEFYAVPDDNVMRANSYDDRRTVFRSLFSFRTVFQSSLFLLRFTTIIIHNLSQSFTPVLNHTFSSTNPFQFSLQTSIATYCFFYSYPFLYLVLSFLLLLFIFWSRAID